MLAIPIDEWAWPAAGIYEAIFYNWRKEHGGLPPSKRKRLKQLEEENSKLKKLFADRSLDKAERKHYGIDASPAPISQRAGLANARPVPQTQPGEAAHRVYAELTIA